MVYSSVYKDAAKGQYQPSKNRQTCYIQSTWTQYSLVAQVFLKYLERLSLFLNNDRNKRTLYFF